MKRPVVPLFAELNGTLIDCYQATTQITDESGIIIADFCNELLDKATGPEGYYGVFTANMHTDSANHAGSDAIIASAQQHNTPVISAKQLLTWMDGRNNSFFGPITWNSNQLSFTITAPAGARNLNAMVPYHAVTGSLVSVTMNGNTIPFTPELIKGIQYAFFNVSTGVNNYQANYSIVPVVTIHPSSQTVCNGNDVEFVSAATGNPLPVVQWQESSDGTSWTDINGATNNTLSFVATPANNNRQYRAVWSNGVGSANSNAAVLTVNPKPVLTSTATPPAVNSGTLFSYSPASNMNGTTFTWKRLMVAGISNATTNGAGEINETLINTTNSPVSVIYTYMLLANNCSNMQNVVVVVNPAATGCTISTSIAANFNGTSIPAGRYIWFNAVFKPANPGNGPVNFNVRNSKITYTVNNQPVVLYVPDAHIRFASNITSASTRFINNKWETEVPLNTTANVFLNGLSYLVPGSLPGGIKNVTWSADIDIDKENVSLQWKWTAGVYTNFAANAGLNVKPVDGLLSILNPLLGVANAGTPLNYTLNIVPGAMGSGLLNITNTYSANASATCTNNKYSLTATERSVMQLSRQPGEPLSSQQKMDVKAMPNPGSDHFTLIIKSDDDKPVTIRVLDMIGKVMEKHEKISAKGVIQLGDAWRAGTYFAEVIQGNERRIIKLIKL